LHPEGPATGHLNQGFLWFSLFPEQMLTELVPKFHIALHGAHAALPMVTLKMSPYTTLTLGWITLFRGDMGEGSLYQEDRKQSSNKEIKIWSGGPAPRWTGRQTVGRNITWNWTASLHCKLQTRPLVRKGALHEK
jgi:hypothetical protein